MKLAISNIAWEVSDDQAVAALLHSHKVAAIHVAPAKYFPDPLLARDREIAAVRQWWEDNGVEITGMQALLFGAPDLNLFGAPDVQDRMLDRLGAVCRIASGLGAKHLVFGSPKNRDKSGLSESHAEAMAVSFFSRLGDVARVNDVIICLEPNPERYGANFMIDSAGTAAIVSALAHPAVLMQLDTGAMTINGEEVLEVIKQFGHLLGHVHASEPDLVPLGEGGTDHARIGAALARHLPTLGVTVEMRATVNEPAANAIDRALAIALRDYRTPSKRAAT